MPAYCDDVVAFRVQRSEDSGGDYVFQAASHRGQIVHASTVWDGDEGGALARERPDPIPARNASAFRVWFLVSMLALPFLLAWYNVLQGRGDRHGAVIYGAAVFTGYLVFDAINAGTESSIGVFMVWVLNQNPFAHAAAHGLYTAMIYLAIEPQVRRIWPHALIGWARLARRRWRDPLVAREVLIGASVALLGLAVAALGEAGVRFLFNGPTVGLHRQPEVLGNSARMLTEAPHTVAVAMVLVLIVYFVLLILYRLIRSPWASTVLGVLLLYPLFAAAGGVPPGRNVEAIAPLIPIVVGLTVVIVVAIRVGLIAAIAASAVGSLVPKIPMTFDPASFYLPQTMLGVLLLVGIVAYGFRYSVAGQPLFGDVLGDRRG